MRTRAALFLGFLLAIGPPALVPASAGVGEGPLRNRAALVVQAARSLAEGRRGAHTPNLVSGVALPVPPPDTSRRAALPDTLARPSALVPDTTPVADDDKPTRKTALFTALAIAVLTISTLLLYNVRSR